MGHGLTRARARLRTTRNATTTAATTGATVSHEPLERRTLFSSAFTNVNVSTRAGNEAEGAIAVDPTNPQRLFTFSNTADEEAGLFAATSDDGGATWATRILAGPGSADGLEPACCDPTASFDEFGNLFIAYLNNDLDVIEVAASTDGGATFAKLTTLGADADQPTITAAEGSVWVTFTEGNRVVASGAAVSALGTVGEFTPLAALPGSQRGAFGDVAIGPSGEVAVTYQRRAGKRSPLCINVDPDGLGPQPFGPRVVAANSGVKLFDIVPAQPERAIDAEVGLAYDRSGGPFDGRLYMVYTDVANGTARDRNNVDVFLRYSNDGGRTWGNALRVNDDTGTATQMLPRVAIDQTTGQVAVTWLDTRDDQDAASADDTDDVVDTDVVLYAVVGTPTEHGLAMSAPARVSAESTNATASENEVELGDYLGLDFRAGTLHPVWSDNSNSTGDNPDGPGGPLDLYTAAIPAASLPTAARFGFAGLPAGGRPGALLAAPDYPVARKPAPLKLTLTFTDPDGLDPDAFEGFELRLTGPGGFDEVPTRRKFKLARGGISATATYLAAGPTGTWSAADDGVYTITLIAESFADGLGNTNIGGPVGNFVVSLG